MVKMWDEFLISTAFMLEGGVMEPGLEIVGYSW